jgi:hypothetical protein
LYAGETLQDVNEMDHEQLFLDIINDIRKEMRIAEKVGDTTKIDVLKQKTAEAEYYLLQEQIYNLEVLLDIIPEDHPDCDMVIRDLERARSRFSLMENPVLKK